MLHHLHSTAIYDRAKFFRISEIEQAMVDANWVLLDTASKYQLGLSEAPCTA
jgi:hypothetical protein